jgi:archaellum biogenesis ATPase FlaH
MSSYQSSKTIKSLLNIGGPLQKMVDSLDGDLSGQVIQLTGGSSTGKSKIAFQIADYLLKNNERAVFLDLDSSFSHASETRLSGANQFVVESFENPTLQYSESKTAENVLKKTKEAGIRGDKILVLDYFQKVITSDPEDFLKKIKELIHDYNMIGIVVVTEKKAFKTDLAKYFHYHLKCSKAFSSNGRVEVSIIKNGHSLICRSFEIK